MLVTPSVFFFLVMILSLQMPMVTLMTDIAVSVNKSRLNVSELSEGMQFAIERTIQTAQQVCLCSFKNCMST